MRWLWRLLNDYALVIIVVLVAGMITGACTVQETPPPKPVRRVEPARNCKDSEPIRLMPNWIRNWNPTPRDRWV